MGKDDELRRKIEAYDPDLDVKESGGSYGHRLADALMKRQRYGETQDPNPSITLSQYKGLVEEMGLLGATPIGAVDSKKSLLRLLGLERIFTTGGEKISLDDATPEQINGVFWSYYQKACK